jgi:hypothetical protein
VRVGKSRSKPLERAGLDPQPVQFVLVRAVSHLVADLFGWGRRHAASPVGNELAGELHQFVEGERVLGQQRIAGPDTGPRLCDRFPLLVAPHGRRVGDQPGESGDVPAVAERDHRRPTGSSRGRRQSEFRGIVQALDEELADVEIEVVEVAAQKCGEFLIGQGGGRRSDQDSVVQAVVQDSADIYFVAGSGEQGANTAGNRR